MVKKVGQTVTIRHGARYDHETKRCDDAQIRGIRTDVITKVFPHGVRTKHNGYVNNSRIIGTCD